MEQEEIRYAINKQVRTIQTVDTDYGPIELDDEAKRVVEQALMKHFKERLEDQQ